MPSKVCFTTQSAFLNDTLKPTLENAKEGLIELFFVDAAHFVQAGLVGRVWAKVRRWVKTSSGRKRFNVLGALNYASKKIETVTNDSYITAVQVVQLLDDLAAKYIGKPIVVVMDNARYQRCAPVKTRADELGITIIHLPTYSPNLNPIERVWKFVKASVLNAVYIDTFSEYCARISNFVETVELAHADKMASLVTDKFQLFDKCKIIENSIK